jgi:hypothetical protein
VTAPRLIAFLSLLLLACQASYADGFDMLSRHEELQSLVIVDTGDFEKIAAPPGKFGVPDVLKLKANCFEPRGNLGLWGIGKKAGLVLVNKEKGIKIALLESSIGSINVKLLTASPMSCPTATSEGLLTDPQILQEMKRIQLELDRLRQQRQ